jgi:hypothetical protein
MEFIQYFVSKGKLFIPFPNADTALRLASDVTNGSPVLNALGPVIDKRPIDVARPN